MTYYFLQWVLYRDSTIFCRRLEHPGSTDWWKLICNTIRKTMEKRLVDTILSEKRWRKKKCGYISDSYGISVALNVGSFIAPAKAVQGGIGILDWTLPHKNSNLRSCIFTTSGDSIPFYNISVASSLSALDFYCFALLCFFSLTRTQWNEVCRRTVINKKIWVQFRLLQCYVHANSTTCPNCTITILCLPCGKSEFYTK